MSFQRSSLRGARRGSGRGNTDNRAGVSFGGLPRPQSTVPTGPYGATIDSIDVKNLLIEEQSPEISNVEYVASYNWIDDKNATILVPGSPPAWTPPAEDIQLKQDSGKFFRDTNAAHFPTFPIEPAIRSVFALQPNFNLQAVDIVGCGSTIGNLLRYASSQTKPFRFDADVVGDTVFLVRRESSPNETINNVKGYGHTFPENYTTWDTDTRCSVSHQRVIQYEFGDLRFLVRTETDGYIRSTKIPTAQESYDGALEDTISSINFNGIIKSGDPKLQLRMQGHQVSQEQIFDIKTRAQQNTFDMQEILPRLWLNQTSKFLLAYHRYGLFDHPKVKDVKHLVKKWQKDNSGVLGRFHTTLRRIVDVLRDSESQQVEISWDGTGPLLISRQIGNGRRALPSDLCVIRS